MTLDSKAQLSASVVFELGTFWFRVHVLSHCATLSICEGGTSSSVWLICFTSFKFFLSDIKCRFHSSLYAQSLIYFWHITIIFSLLSLFIIYSYVMYQFILVKPMGLVSYTIADLWLWCSQFYSCVIIFILRPW